MITPEVSDAPIAGPATVEITAADVNFYRDNGYLVVADALSPAEVDSLRRETVRICRASWAGSRDCPPLCRTRATTR